MIGWLGADGFDWLFFFLLFFLSIYSYPFLRRYVLTTKILVGRFEHLDCYFRRRRRRRRRSSERVDNKAKQSWKRGRENQKEQKEKEQNVRTVIQKSGRLRFGYLYLRYMYL